MNYYKFKRETQKISYGKNTYNVIKCLTRVMKAN